jgi:hypothetical protein
MISGAIGAPAHHRLQAGVDSRLDRRVGDDRGSPPAHQLGLDEWTLQQDRTLREPSQRRCGTDRVTCEMCRPQLHPPVAEHRQQGALEPRRGAQCLRRFGQDCPWRGEFSQRIDASASAI